MIKNSLYIITDYIADTQTIYTTDDNGNSYKLSLYVADYIDETNGQNNDLIPTCSAVIDYCENKIKGTNITNNSDSTIDLTINSFTEYTYELPVSSILLNINPNIQESLIKFTTASICAYTFCIDESYKINKQLDFQENKSYIIAIDNGVIIWDKIEQYESAREQLI